MTVSPGGDSSGVGEVAISSSLPDRLGVAELPLTLSCEPLRAGVGRDLSGQH